MSDTSPKNQDALTAGYRHTATPPAPKPRSLLFEFDHGDQHVRCELLEHGDEFGVEAQFTVDGELLESQRFDSPMLAALWADGRRAAIERDL